MTRITPPADDLGRQLLQIENRKPATARAVDKTASGAAVRDPRGQTPAATPGTSAPPRVERRQGERRRGERRRRQQAMFIDTRTGQDRRRNAGKRSTDQLAPGPTRGIDVEV